MKVAALLCGVIGGLAGLVGALVVFGLGALIGGFGGGGEMALDGIGALVMAVVGIVGGAMAIAKPLPAAILMAVAAVLGFIFISIGFFIGSILLLIGAVLAFVPWLQGRRAGGQS